MFGNELRLKAAVAVMRYLDGQGAEIALEGLSAAAVARVAAIVGDGFVFVVA